MAAKVLDEMRISPAKNGGYTVRHSYKAQPRNGGRGDIGMHYPESEEHVFGAGQDAKLQSHIATTLGLKRGGATNGSETC